MEKMSISQLSNLSRKRWDKIEHLYCDLTYGKFDKKLGTNNLRIIKKILNGESITFWLTLGTLLGAIREKDFISWDNDIDLVVYEEEFLPKYNILKEKFISKGFIFRDWHKSEGTKVGLFKKKQKITIDCLFLDPSYRDNKFRLSKQWRYPSIFFERYETIKFRDMLFRVPSPSKSFLKYVYGKSWTVPIEPKKNRSIREWRRKECSRKDKKFLC